MKRQFINIVALVTVGVMIFGLIGLSSVLATVPGNNKAVSVNSSGGTPDNSAGPSDVSQDGRYVAFSSYATNLVSPATNGHSQIFVRDMLNNTTTLVSISSSGTQGNDNSVNPRMSENGRYVVFESWATNLVSNDTNATDDVFIHDMTTGTTQLVSTSSTGVQGDKPSQTPDVTADGNYVVFRSGADNLIASPVINSSYGAIFLKNLATGELTLLDISASTGDPANGNTFSPQISCEGRFVIFQSYANNLVAGDTYNPTKSKVRIYVVDMFKSIDPEYIKGDADGTVGDASISCNGDYITFISSATNIVAGDTNGHYDSFIYDRIKNTFDRVSVASDGTEGNGDSNGYPTASNDGNYVTFGSSATNLVPSDTNGTSDIFLHNRVTGTTELVTRDSAGNIGNGVSGITRISSDGRYVAYSSAATNLVSGFSPSYTAIYESETGASAGY